MTRGKGVRPFGEHVDDLVPVYFAEITSMGPSRFHDGGPSQVTPGGRSGRWPDKPPCMFMRVSGPLSPWSVRAAKHESA